MGVILHRKVYRNRAKTCTTCNRVIWEAVQSLLKDIETNIDVVFIFTFGITYLFTNVCFCYYFVLKSVCNIKYFVDEEKEMNDLTILNSYAVVCIDSLPHSSVTCSIYLDTGQTCVKFVFMNTEYKKKLKAMFKIKCP